MNHGPVQAAAWMNQDDVVNDRDGSPHLLQFRHVPGPLRVDRVDDDPFPGVRRQQERRDRLL